MTTFQGVKHKFLQIIKRLRVSQIESLEDDPNIIIQSDQIHIKSDSIILGNTDSKIKINSHISISNCKESGLLLPIHIPNGQIKYIKLYDLI